MKNTINSKGLIKAPSHLKKSILIYSENRLLAEEEKENEIRQYLEILPFSFLVLMIRDLFKGKEIRIRPVIDF